MLPTPSNLDGLIALSRQNGIDVRPTLVRVLTDLYVQKQDHTAEERGRYVELAGRLLDSVDEQTRVAVARKLSTCHDAPHSIVLRLACDVFDVAEPILRQSPCLTEEDLLAIANGTGGRHADAIAARERPVASDQARPASATEPAAAEPAADVEPVAAVEPAAETDAKAGESPRPTPADAAEAANLPGLRPAPETGERSIGEQFFAADPDQRLALLAQIEVRRLDGRAPQPAPSEDAIRALDAAVLDSRAAVTDHFMRTFNLTSEVARRILDDPHGEPLMIALKALGAPSEVLVRALLLVNPAVGQSVERVFSLVGLYDEISAAAASHLVASWGEAAAGRRRARHQPLLFDDETRARRGTGEAARRATPQSGESRTSDPQRRQRTI